MTCSTQPSLPSSELRGLTLRGVVKRFARRGGEPLTVLDGIDLDCPPGSFTALIGPSGCGKSTVLRLATGLDVADAGEVAIGGESPVAVTRRGELGVAFQDPALLPWRSVESNIALPLDVHLPAQDLVEGAERLVEQQEPRLGDQGAGDGNPLSHAAG